MGKTSLETMQAIEEEAQALIAGYEQKIANLESALTIDLETVARDYDQETQHLIADLEASSLAEIDSLKQEVERRIAQNQEKVAKALTARKADLVTDLVDKVVARYGH